MSERKIRDECKEKTGFEPECILMRKKKKEEKKRTKEGE